MEDNSVIRVKKHILRKHILSFVLIIICLSNNRLQSFASKIDTIPIIEEIDLSQDLNFTVNNNCSGHTYFMQAAANTRGCFLVYSRHINPDNYSDVNFKKVYIDVYHSDGTFWQELSFTASFDMAVAFEENTVIIYFYDSVLVYDLATQEIHSYAISEGAAISEGLYKELRSKEFTVGEWTYLCKKAFGDYVELVRSNGNQVQVLVEMPGTSSFWGNVVFPGSVIGIGIMAIIIFQFKRNRRRKKAS